MIRNRLAILAIYHVPVIKAWKCNVVNMSCYIFAKSGSPSCVHRLQPSSGHLTRNRWWQPRELGGRKWSKNKQITNCIRSSRNVGKVVIGRQMALNNSKSLCLTKYTFNYFVLHFGTQEGSPNRTIFGPLIPLCAKSAPRVVHVNFVATCSNAYSMQH